MACFTITFAPDTAPTTDPVRVHCDAYAQEGAMLTFFKFGPDRDAIDYWSERVASYRTSEIRSIVSLRTVAAAPEPVPVLVAC